MYRYGKVALVVGASSGVGKEIALFLKKQGYTVYGTSRKGTSENNLISLDITQEISVQEAITTILKKENTIDILVNCPGYGLTGSIEDTTIEEAQAVFDTNFFGIMRMCQAVLPIMRKQKRGLIVNISSVAGFISIPFQSMYSASKFALESMTESLRMEVKPYGIKAALIDPGDMKTNFVRKYTEKSHNSIYQARCDKAVNVMIHDEQNGSLPIVVVKEFKKILRSKNPSVRRVVGIKYKFFRFIKRFVPDQLIEYIVGKIY